MNSIDQIKEKCSQFIRISLPAIRKVAVNMPTIPYFYAEPSDKKGRYKFIETTQTNWWQLPKDLKASLYKTPEVQTLVNRFENTPPFSKIISK